MNESQVRTNDGRQWLPRGHRLSPAKRLAATAMLAIGLLGVGGVAIVSAADPTPTPTSSTSTTTTQTTTPSSTSGTGSATTTNRSGHTCPNKTGSSSSTSSTSSGSSN